jgi:hypothetical protein
MVWTEPQNCDSKSREQIHGDNPLNFVSHSRGSVQWRAGPVHRSRDFEVERLMTHLDGDSE